MNSTRIRRYISNNGYLFLLIFLLLKRPLTVQAALDMVGKKNERKKNEKKTKKNERTSLFSFEIIDIGFVSPLLKVLPLFVFLGHGGNPSLQAIQVRSAF